MISGIAHTVLVSCTSHKLKKSRFAAIFSMTDITIQVKAKPSAIKAEIMQGPLWVSAVLFFCSQRDQSAF